MATKIREGTQTPEGWYKKLGATTTEEESWHFKVGDPACQETDWDGRRSRALLTAQADDRNDADSSLVFDFMGDLLWCFVFRPELDTVTVSKQ